MPQLTVGKTLSKLESLPPELIDIVFLEALEVNLARASFHIAQRVSRKRVYDIFLLQAYWNDPQDSIRDPYLHRDSIYQDVSLPKTNYADREIVVHTFSDIGYQPLRLVEQERLQRLVASCRWFTLAKFQTILPSLRAITLNTVDHQRVLSGLGVINHWMNRRGLGSAYDYARSTKSSDYDREPRELRVLDDFTVAGTYHNAARGRAHMIRVVRVFCFPSKVLHGPWTDAQLHFLIHLRCAFGKRFRWYDEGAWFQIQRTLSPSFSMQACFHGIEDAILEKNESALRYLLDVLQTFGPSMGPYRRQIHVPAGLYWLASRCAASHPQSLDLLLQIGSNALPQTRCTFRWVSKRIARGDWLSICAFSYLWTHIMRMHDSLRKMLPASCQLQDTPRATQQLVLLGLARGSVLNGEAVF